MERGKVKWFNDAYGYGFVQDEQGQDVFVHYSVILASGYKSLEDGQEVRFDAETGPKGRHATAVIAGPADA